MGIESKIGMADFRHASDLRWASMLVATLLFACATAPPETQPPSPQPPKPGEPAAPAPAPPSAAPPSLGFFSRIKAPDTVQPVLKLQGRGVQVFRCEPRGSGFTWVFRLPEAELVDAAGKQLVRHGANFSFEHVDGSRLLGSVVDFDDAPDTNNLRWLLLSTRSFGQGELTNVLYVQRVNTNGGMPPARCEAAQQNRLLRVDFSADFVFYKPR
jgi:hypothetical protein